MLVTPPTPAFCTVTVLLGKVLMNQLLTLPAKDRGGLSCIGTPPPSVMLPPMKLMLIGCPAVQTYGYS